MHTLIIKTKESHELFLAITNGGVKKGEDPRDIKYTLATNQAVRDDRIIKDAISIIKSYSKLGVKCYDDELEWLLAKKD